MGTYEEDKFTQELASILVTLFLVLLVLGAIVSFALSVSPDDIAKCQAKTGFTAAQCEVILS